MQPNGVKMNLTTSGTGTAWTLTSISGYPTFNNTCQTGEYVYCTVSDGSNWQWCIISVGATNAATLVKVLENYVAGVYSVLPATPMSLSGSAVIAPSAQQGNYFRPMTRPIPAAVRANTVVFNQLMTGAPANLSNGAGFARFFPYRIPTCGQLSAMTVYVASAVAASNMYLGLYDIDETGMPHTLLDYTGAIDSSTTGPKSASSTNSVFLEPGDYYLGTLQVGGASAVSYTGYNSICPTWGGDNTNLQALNDCYLGSQASLPASVVSPTFETVNINSITTPCVGLNLL